MRVRRFEVAEESMLPSLHPGDFLVAVSGMRIRKGDVVVFPHPARAGFWLVKRVAGVAGEPMEGLVARAGEVPKDHLLVLSDDPTATRADSRTFGPVSTRRAHRVLLRYWPLRRVTFRLSRSPGRLTTP